MLWNCCLQNWMKNINGVSSQFHGLGALLLGERAHSTHWVGGWLGPTVSLDAALSLAHAVVTELISLLFTVYCWYTRIAFIKCVHRNCLLLITSNCCIVLLLLESLKLQRNLDNYAFLRSSRAHGLENLDDKQDFQVTRVSILASILLF
jgi:hypothetical protein